MPIARRAWLSAPPRRNVRGRRYLRIVLSEASNADDEAIAIIGHELQHAVEVATDPGIEEAADIKELYRRIGYVPMKTAAVQLYETQRAVSGHEDIGRTPN